MAFVMVFDGSVDCFSVSEAQTLQDPVGKNHILVTLGMF